MKKKKSHNSLKGLLLILVIILAFGAHFVIQMSRSNMLVYVAVFGKDKPLNGARVELKGKTYITDDKGSAYIKMRASEGDKVVISTKHDNFKGSTDTLFINKDRLLSKHTNKYIVLEQG